MANGYTFQWSIKYLSHCWFKKGESFDSPKFLAHTSPPSEWSLVLYSRGIITDDHLGVCIRREEEKISSGYHSGPEIIEASFQIAVLNIHGSIVNLRNGATRGFARGGVSGIEEIFSLDKIFGTEKEKFFPLEILTIHCTLWVKDYVPIMTNHLSAWSTFSLNHRSFVWRIDKFTLRFGYPHKKTFVVMNESLKNLVEFAFVRSDTSGINLKLVSCDESIKSFSLRISIIDSKGRKLNLKNHIFLKDFPKVDMLLISIEQLMENKDLYLPNDDLTLYCKFTFSTGDILHKYVDNSFESIYPKEMKMLIESEDKPVDRLVNANSQSQALLDDLKSMYRDAILCDIELRTSTKTFPAHMNILSARSSVFRRMFSSDMKEKNSGHVNITDLEDDTLHRMLHYIYTDAFEDLQFEMASKLYAAADKYAIFSLKEKCSCFLKENMIPTKVCDLLDLADRHQDNDLKSVAQDYILCHDKEVFTSVEWKDFMTTNLQLAAEIMYRKVSSS